jgi:putative phage-type endonuclease
MKEYPKYYFDIEQKSDEWFNIRSDKITASHAQAIGNYGKGLETYIIEKMAAYYSNAEQINYTNENMERGNELEKSAATIYSFETGLKTQKIGFVEWNEYVGASPDIFVENNGMAEIKCPNDRNYFQLLLDFEIDTKYMWQMQMGMLCCLRSWNDYVVYNPNFSKSLLIKRVYPDKKIVEALLKGFKIAEERIKEITNLMAQKGEYNHLNNIN